MQNKLWYEYTRERRTVVDLARQYGRSCKWIRRKIANLPTTQVQVIPRDVVLVIDALFFGRHSGILVFLDAVSGKTVHYREIGSESTAEYQMGVDKLRKDGFAIVAAVIDGRRGVRELLTGIPVQMCQFHQIRIVRRYITSRPHLEAGKGLREITLQLTRLTEAEFSERLDAWHKMWGGFIAEKTYHEDGKHWHYTHRRVRSAYMSLKRNMPFLFTYKKHPALGIPNTTNFLESLFARVREIMYVHRGANPFLKRMLLVDILNF